MAKRPRYSRYRRLPPVFRFGEFKLPDAGQEEQRLTVYLPGSMLDLAEAQASRARIETVQEYCALLLARAIEMERARGQVADLEAKRGPLEGLHAINADPAFLTEWSAQAALDAPEDEEGSPTTAEPESEPPIPVEVRIVGFDRSEASAGRPTAGPEPLGAAGEVVLRHAGHAGDDPMAFLPSLRRGEAVRLDEVAELAEALRTLEEKHRGATAIDRRLAYALHRLAFEGQVLHTDAWPGTFDDWTIETLRAVQEYVDRILSGQDIRYYPPSSSPETSP